MTPHNHLKSISSFAENFVHGAPYRLRQILTNLIDNALKFTVTGNISVSVRPDAGDSESIGIPLDAQEKIFDSFSQADGSMTRTYVGTGLELAIVKQLVDMIRGHLGLRNRPREGTTFWFTIPLSKTAPSADSSLPAASWPAHSNTATPARAALPQLHS